MTNDLLDRDGTGAPEEPRVPDTAGTPAENAPGAGEDAGLLELLEAPLTPEEPPAPAGEEPAPAVFAPSPWERRRDREGDAARREAQHQEKAAQREARRAEKKIAQDQRKAQEEARRQEARAREEERRQEARRRVDEKREEAAQRGRVRRVGTMTLGVSLIAIGVAILLYMINPGFDVRVVAYLAPVILISLGAEVLIRYFFSKDRTYKYDFASGIICIFLVLGSFSISLMPYVVYYVGPERFASEEELLAAEREKVYQAFRGDQRVRDYYIGGSIDHSLATARRGEDDRWVYQLSYLYTTVSLLDPYPDEAAFARTCRELMDKLADQGVGLVERGSSYIEFRCGENEEGVSYSLSINNRLKMEMDADTLTKLVEATHTRPTIENGWYPGGYDELESDFGTRYADHFAQLLELYDAECAGTYHSLLYNYDEEVAERYYRSVMEESSGRQQDASEGTPEPADETGEPADEGETGEPVDAGEAEAPPSRSDSAAETSAIGAESTPPPAPGDTVSIPPVA